MVVFQFSLADLEDTASLLSFALSFIVVASVFGSCSRLFVGVDLFPAEMR